MGRHPRLPVDCLFDFEDDGESKHNHTEYVSKHLENMKAAYRKAGEHLRKEARSREEAHSVRGPQQILEAGTRVLTRNIVQGRNKIQDKWNSSPFVVVKCLDTERPIYLIEPLDNSGPRRIENRTNLQTCRFENCSDSESSDDETVVVGYSTPKPLRRSTRSTAGKHSNIHHEPRSAL